MMDFYLIELIKTAILILIVLFARIFSAIILRRISNEFNFGSGREAMILRVVHIAIYFVALIFLVGIWGVDKNELALYIGSTLTVLGVAFFAQWSHLSNITAGVILFINHPAKIGDTITIKDMANPISGIITNIGLFFVSIRTQSEEDVLIANALFLQRTVSILRGQTAIDAVAANVPDKEEEADKKNA